jgi:hypothetical protein
MRKTCVCDKDTYIVDRVINGLHTYNANVGGAGTCDLYKLYGFSSSGSVPNTELTRLLVHFDLDPVRELISSNKIDVSNTTFNAKLLLHDVYGGQPTPSNFTIDVFALSASFTEGTGRDIVQYSDNDVCNWLTASSGVTWLLAGCSSTASFTSSVPCDYFSDVKATQTFIGEEDLFVDVTTIVSATLSNTIPDEGFRISFSSQIESDEHTYFVKRFATRTAYDKTLAPKLIIRYDNSIQDDTQIACVNTPTTLFLYNYQGGELSNVLSSSTSVTGINCLNLRLEMPISGGTIVLPFSASQHYSGINPVVGMYSSSFVIPQNTQIITELNRSGSLAFTPIWASLDNTLGYVTGSTVTFYPPQRTSKQLGTKKFVVNVLGIVDEYSQSETTTLRVNIFDYSSPLITVVKVPVELPGIVIRDVHYQVRDIETNNVIVSFDTVYNSTRVSSDAVGMFFELDMSNLISEHTYVIDILIKSNGTQRVYKNVSQVFRVVSDTLT